MAKKTTESPQQLSFDFDDWLAPPAAPEPAPEQASISPRFALAERLSEILDAGEPRASLPNLMHRRGIGPRQRFPGPVGGGEHVKDFSASPAGRACPVLA